MQNFATRVLFFLQVFVVPNFALSSNFAHSERGHDFLIYSDSLEHHSNLTGSQGQIRYLTRDKTFGKSWDQTRVLLPQISFRDHSNHGSFGGFFLSVGMNQNARMHSFGYVGGPSKIQVQISARMKYFPLKNGLSVKTNLSHNPRNNKDSRTVTNSKRLKQVRNWSLPLRTGAK